MNISAVMLHLVVMTMPLLWALHAHGIEVFSVKPSAPTTVVTLPPTDLKTLQTNASQMNKTLLQEETAIKQMQQDTDAIKKKLKIP